MLGTFRTERVFIITALLFIGLAVTMALNGGALGTGLEHFAGLVWVMIAALVLLAAAGATWLRGGAVRQAADIPDAQLPLARVPLSAITPALLVVGYSLFLQLFQTGLIQGAILVLAGASFAVVYWAQVHSVNSSDRYFALAQFLLNLGSHLVAFLLFSVIYGLKTRALYSSTGVFLVASLLTFEMLTRDATWHAAMAVEVDGRRRIITLLSLITGLVAAELTWGLIYWAALSTLVGGAFLLVAFYVMYGLVSHYVDGTLNRTVFIEFGVVGAVALAAFFASAFFS